MYPTWRALGMGAAGEPPDSVYPLKAGELEWWANVSEHGTEFVEAAGIVFDATRPERVETPLADLADLIAALPAPKSGHRGPSARRWPWLINESQAALSRHGQRAVLSAW